MKYLSFLLLTVFLSTCDTAKRNNETAAAPAAESVYVSPPVQPEREPLRPLPPDSIPVEYSVKGIAQAPVGFAGMMGEWVAAYDAQESVRFLPGKYVSYYQNEKVVEESMTYYDVCPATCTGGAALQVPCFVLASDYDRMCFAVTAQTAERLDLTLLGTENATLTYYRKANN